MININSNWYIDADANQYTLKCDTGKIDSESGKNIYTPEGYYSTLHQALRGYRSKIMRDRVAKSEIVKLDDYILQLRELTETLTDELEAQNDSHK